MLTGAEAHEHTHADVSGGWLRAAVFGAMDGLVTNTALVAGVGGGGAGSHAVVLSGVAGLAAGPAQAFVTRRVEARADAHALALTGDAATFEAMQRRLGTVNLADPDPPAWEHVLFASHPSTVERMAAARAFARGER